MRQAFSLVELSIVMVILGLMVGGLLAGQSLVRASQLRSVTRDRDTITTAFNMFRDKYFNLPGDMPNASQFWGAADGGNGQESDCITAIIGSSALATCNGDGNQRIDHSHSATTYEMMLAWPHLVKAGLIEGGLVYSNTPLTAVPGTNVPASRAAQGAGWGACYTNHGTYGSGDRNMMTLGKPGWSGTPCAMGNGAGISPDEAWSIDTKIDDGRPGTGIMTAEDGADGTSWSTCTNSGFGWTSTAGTYLVQNTSLKFCRIFFPLR